VNGSRTSALGNRFGCEQGFQNGIKLLSHMVG
jgi:hypothetical protein